MIGGETKGDLTPEDLIDAPRNVQARKKQEDLWKETKVNVRQQLHAREAALAHKQRVVESISYYHVCQLLLHALTDSHSPFHKLNIDTLCEIAKFWFHGQQPKLLRAIRKRNSMQIGKAAPSNAAFRLFLRQRKLKLR